jgi:small ligand-binding sensory domain FIST
MPTPPRFASALSTEPESARAEQQVLAQVREQLQGRSPDLCVVFVSHHYGAALEELGQRLSRAVGAKVLVGCTGESIIGTEREVEQEPALSLWCASLPGVDVRAFAAIARATPEEGIAFSALPTVVDPSRASLLLLADPYSFPADAYLSALAEALPRVPVFGGMASGGMGPGQNLLFTQEGLVAQGAIGVALEGAIEVRTVVSQGCRPVGRPWVVTQSHENLLLKLGGRPALDVLKEVLAALSDAERALFQRGPFIGLAIDASRSQFTRGDFLVRNLLGVSREQNAVAVSDMVRRGQTVQFLVRDAASAGEDLEQLMLSQGGGALASSDEPGSVGALLFTCNGRGRRMFDVPNHDIDCVRRSLVRAVPVAGFFAQGELGPVGGRNFLHGYTASVAVFRPRAQES